MDKFSKAQSSESSVRFPHSIIGIGVCQVELEFFLRTISQMQPGLPVALVVIEHDVHDTLAGFRELLAESTALTVKTLHEGEEVLSDCIYLAPHNRNVSISAGKFRVSPIENELERGPDANATHPIDVFLCSLACERAVRVAGLILCGSAAVGSTGIRAIRNVGGLTIVQTSDSPHWESMEWGVNGELTAHRLLDPAEVAGALTAYVAEAHTHKSQELPDQMAGLNWGVTDYQQALSAIQKGKQRLEQLVDAAQVGILFLESDGTVVRLNDAMLNLLKLPRQQYEAMGLNWRQIAPTRGTENLKVLVRQASLMVPQATLHCFDGSQLSVMLNGQRLLEDDDEYVIFVTNLTSQLKQQQQIRDSEARYRSLTQITATATWSTDAHGHVTSNQPLWQNITDQSFAEQGGLGWIDAFHPEDRSSLCKNWTSAVEAAKTFLMEARLYHHRQRGYRMVEVRGVAIQAASGEVSEWILAARDIHDAWMSQKALVESQERLRLALNAADLTLWEWDVETNSITWSNELTPYLGSTKSGKVKSLDQVLAMLHPDDRAAAEAKLKASLQRCSPFLAEIRLQCPQGGYRWIRCMAQVLADSTGSPVRMVGVELDITKRKEFETSLKHARDVAESANRSRGEFLANMSHEIRTPMTAILGYAEILHDHLQDPDNLQCVETIRRNGRFLLEIIDDILDLSRVDANKFEVDRQLVKPDCLVADVQSLMRVRAEEKGLELKVEHHGQLPAVIQTDGKRLRQILLNLVGNAIKFTDEGSVTLATRCLEHNNKIEFRVIDTGIGIDESDLEKLFEPFTQADSSSTRSIGGTGLGLTISRRLARMLGGDIDIHTQLGKGSVFIATVDMGALAGIDMVTPDPFLNRPREAVDQIPPIRLSGRVLIVDDRRDIRLLAQRFVEEAGGEVVTAVNGLDAIETIERLAKESIKVDLVVMDMQMPIMDGYQAARQLRNSGFRQPIIALTADAMEGARAHCINAGCDDYTTKPLDRRAFQSVIAKYLLS